MKCPCGFDDKFCKCADCNKPIDDKSTNKSQTNPAIADKSNNKPNNGSAADKNQPNGWPVSPAPPGDKPKAFTIPSKPTEKSLNRG